MNTMKKLIIEILDEDAFVDTLDSHLNSLIVVATSEDGVKSLKTTGMVAYVETPTPKGNDDKFDSNPVMTYDRDRKRMTMSNAMTIKDVARHKDVVRLERNIKYLQSQIDSLRSDNMLTLKLLKMFANTEGYRFGFDEKGNDAIIFEGFDREESE